MVRYGNNTMNFPSPLVNPYDFNQPTAIAHVGEYSSPLHLRVDIDLNTDTTLEWCRAMARHLNPHDVSVSTKRLQCIK